MPSEVNGSDYNMSSNLTSLSSNCGDFSYSKEIRKYLSASKNDFNVAHFNANSLFGSRDEVINIFSNLDLHCIAVSETFLSKHILDKSVLIPNYKLIRNDRPDDSRRGGVCIYIRRDLKFRIVAKSDSNKFEFLALEVDLNFNKFLLGVFYNRPNSGPNSNLLELESVFCDLCSKFENVIFTGDFNIDMLNSSSASKFFGEILDTCGLLHKQSNATRVTNRSATLIDLFLSNLGSRHIKFGQVALAGVSDHDLILSTFAFPIPNLEPTYYFIRNYKGINIENLVINFHSKSIERIYEVVDVNDKVEFLTSTVLSLLNEEVPLLRCKSRNAHVPWFNDEIQFSISQRDIAYRRWRRNRTSDSKDIYHRLRNQTTQLIKNAKRNYSYKILDPNLPSKKLWNNLRNAGVHPSKSELVTSFTPDDLNTAFSYNSNFRSEDITSGLNYDPDSNFYFNNVGDDEVIRAINKIKSNAIGPDLVPLKFLKIILPGIIPYLTHLFNHMLTTSTFPFSWKLAHVTPIPKISIPLTTSDFRGISKLSIFSKIFENLALDQILMHVKQSNLLISNQSGFRRGRSTATALCKITDDIRYAIDQKKCTALVLLDFTKAFDSINHNILLAKLVTEFNFSCSAMNLIRAYITNRSQVVCLGDNLSSTVSLKAGVPQGSILGPLLFSLFINDLPGVLRYADYHMYADDVQIYISDKLDNITECISNLNDDLQCVFDWSVSNGLALNPSKTQAIVFSRTAVLNVIPDIKLNNNVVKLTTKVKNLGVLFDSDLS